jgi:hypothetical protein
VTVSVSQVEVAHGLMPPLFFLQPGLQPLRQARAELVDLPEYGPEHLQVGRQSSFVVSLPGGPQLLALPGALATARSEDAHRAAESRPHPEPSAEPAHLPIEPSQLGALVS